MCFREGCCRNHALCIISSVSSFGIPPSPQSDDVIYVQPPRVSKLKDSSFGIRPSIYVLKGCNDFTMMNSPKEVPKTLLNCYSVTVCHKGLMTKDFQMHSNIDCVAY